MPIPELLLLRRNSSSHPASSSILILHQTFNYLAFQPSSRILGPYSTGIVSPASAEVVGSILCTGENTLIYCSPCPL